MPFVHRPNRGHLVDVAHHRHTLHLAGHVQRTPTVCNVDSKRSPQRRTGVRKVAFLTSRAGPSHARWVRDAHVAGKATFPAPHAGKVAFPATLARHGRSRSASRAPHGFTSLVAARRAMTDFPDLPRTHLGLRRPRSRSPARGWVHGQLAQALVHRLMPPCTRSNLCTRRRTCAQATRAVTAGRVVCVAHARSGKPLSGPHRAGKWLSSPPRPLVDGANGTFER